MAKITRKVELEGTMGFDEFADILRKEKVIASDENIIEVTVENRIIAFKAVNEAKQAESPVQSPASTLQLSEISEEILKTKLDDMNFPTRALRAFKSYDVKTIEDLVRYEKGGVLKMRNMGEATLATVNDALKEFSQEKGLKGVLVAEMFD